MRPRENSSKAVFSTKYGGAPCHWVALGLVPANRLATCRYWSQRSLFFPLRKKPEINLRARRSSPHKLGVHALQRELSRLTSEPLGSVEGIPTCVVETEVLPSGTWGPLGHPGITPVFRKFSHETNDDEFVMSLPQ